MSSHIAYDVRQAVRRLRQSPGFTITVILTLALGIGANTAIFTLIQGILLRSLPVSDPAQIYRIGDRDDCCVEGGFQNDNGDFDIFSYAMYQQFKQNAPEFESLAAVRAGRSLWGVRRGAGTAMNMQGELVSGNYFSTLGVQPLAGRLFNDSDDHEGAPITAVISYDAWQSEFGGDRTIVGSTVNVQTQPVTILGIAPRGFFGERVSSNPPEIWLTLSAQPRIDGQSAETALIHQPGEAWLYPIGRVRPGTNIAGLQAKLTTLLRNWLSTQDQYTRNGGAAVAQKQFAVLQQAGGGVQNLQQETGQALDLLMILAAVVLLIACANIASVLLARATARRAEIAIRMALGENQSRLVRRMLTECLLLGCFGGLAGLAVAYYGARYLLALNFPTAKHSAIAATPDWTILGFAFVVSLLTGVLFGIAPAWLATHADPAEALRGANRSTRDRSRLPQNILVVFQAALSLVLLAGALLTTRSLDKLQNQGFGVETANRYVVHIDPQGAGYTVQRVPQLYRQIEDRVGTLPGVSSLGLGMYSPLEGDNWGECAIPEGSPAPGPNSKCGATWLRVSPGYLDSIGVKILRGRGFTESDTATSPQVAVVNESFVKRFFPKTDPIGKRFGIDDVKYSGAWQIVGVMRDFKINNPRRDVRPTFIRPLAQYYNGYQEPAMKAVEDASMFMNAMVIDFSHPMGDVEPQLRRTLGSIDPNLAITDLRSFDSQVAMNFTQDRLLARLSELFALLALVLAVVGLYGVTAYLVARRRSEIGIRMALGATGSNVVMMVLRGVAVQVVLGLVIGVPAAIWAGHFMKDQLYQIKATDPPSLGAAAVVLVVCALAAGGVPASKAAATDPIQTLKAE